MKLEINMISREMVTPSSSTPSHLKTYNLSLLDQTSPPLLMPHVVFYPANDDDLISNSEKSNHLKKSLSKALTLFYPVAGRLVGSSYINCNDEGVMYYEAQANCNLSDVITNPIAEEVNKLVECDPTDDATADHCFVVQATFFSCGGLAVGFGISHKLADAFSHFMFVNSWAAISRGDDDHIQSPIFESATLFPPRELGIKSLYKKRNKENIVTKRFVFSPSKIEGLRDRYTGDTNDEGFIRPTRIETLSAFIWTRFMVATGAKGDTSKVYALRLTVDIRKIVVPPLSERHFGNYVLRTFAVPSLENDEDSRYGVVKKIRDAIRKVDQDYVAKLPERDDLMNSVVINGREEKESEGKVDIFGFSSVCRIPLNESDFGWGKPVWVASGKIPVSKMVFFADSISGGGIDAWVNLNVEDMAKFEADEELNQYIQ